MDGLKTRRLHRPSANTFFLGFYTDGMASRGNRRFRLAGDLPWNHIRRRRPIWLDMEPI